MIVAADIVRMVKSNTFHPVVYRYAPYPGYNLKEEPIRVKSIGHHTEGFGSLEEAQAYIKSQEWFPLATCNTETFYDCEDADVFCSVRHIYEGRLA